MPPEEHWPQRRSAVISNTWADLQSLETEALKQKAGVGSRYRLREKYVNQQFYGSDANELRKAVEIEWVGASPVTVPKKDLCGLWAFVTD